MTFLAVINLSAALVMDSSFNKIISHFMHQQYSKARIELESILKKRPRDIDALFMQINAGQIEIIDYESYVISGFRFLKSIDSTLVILEKAIGNCSEDKKAQYLFYTGTVYGMKSLIQAKLGEWFNAIKNSRMYVALLKEALEIDTTMIEPLYGIGLVDYYIGENLKWLPFMSRKARDGLDNIEKVAESSSPLNFMAKNSLAWIYVEREEYKKADALVSSVLAEYPNNTIFLRIKARIALNVKKYNEAVTLSRRLKELSQKRNPVNWSDLFDAYQILVASLAAQGKYRDCLHEANKALDLEVPVSAKKIEYVQKHLKYIVEKKKGIEEKL